MARPKGSKNKVRIVKASVDYAAVVAEKTAEKDGVVTFTTVNLKDNQFYTWVNEYGTEYPDVPYMLTMDSKGTVTLKDDEILVVWANN